MKRHRRDPERRTVGFYQRLRAAGTPAKVALVAVMRRLLTITTAMLKHQTAWQQSAAWSGQDSC